VDFITRFKSKFLRGKRLANFDSLLAQYLDNLQFLQHQILLTDAVLIEFIEETARHFDQLDALLEGRSTQQADIDRESLQRILRQYRISLNRLREQEAIYAGLPPVELQNQIDIVIMKIEDIERQLVEQA
jgi:hypothetical protein